MSRSLRFLFALLMAGLWGGTAAVAPAAAQQQISGTVIDATDSTSIPGVNIVVPGTTVGTATAADGTYQLSAPAEADSLRFSFVGYEPRTVAIAGRSTIDVALGTSAAQLQDLVVVGYGEQEQRDVTGVISTVTPEDFNTTAAVSPEQLISGKIAGVQVSATDGAPGSGNLIRIRGATSVNASSAPLFVVDGVPISNEGNTASRNPLNFLNPDDIASMTVLKDASATAIYGSRGANGVILIETKDGTVDGVQVTYSGEVQASSITDEIDVLGAGQFREVVGERAPEMASMLGDAETDWQDVIQRPGVGQEHSLSLSRGYEDADFRISLGYLDQEGTLETSSTERVSLSLAYNQRLLDDRLSLSTSLRGVRTKDQFEPGALVGSAASFAPTQPIRDVGSAFGGFFEWDQQLAENNPAAEFILTENSGTNYRSLGNLDAEYDLPFVEGLSLRTVFGYDVATGERELFRPTFLKGEAEGANPGRIERASFTRVNRLFDAYLSYDSDFASINSSLDATVGYSYQDFDEEYPELMGSGLDFNFLGPNSANPISEDDSGISVIPSRLISGFARVNYTFMDKYLLTATVRRDGSSRFGPENQWGTFPSAALAWRAHQEPFLRDAAPWLSNLKARVSWGIVGNQEIGDFQYASFYALGGQNAQVQFGDRFVTTLRPSAADPSIKWEETTTTNVGVDYGLFAGRVTGSLEYYVSDTDDLLFTIDAPAGANLSDRVLTNIGSMRNEGLEFSVNALVVDTDAFSYNAQLNVSTNRNELLRIDRGGQGVTTLSTGGISGGVGNTIQVLREGEPLNAFSVYRHKRDANGDPIYEDIDGNGLINEQDLYEDVAGATDTLASGEVVQIGDSIINEDDRVLAGDPQPDWIIGHTSQLTYRDVDFSFTLRAHLGGQVYNNVASNYGHYDRLTEFVPSNLHTSVLETGFVAPQYFSDVYVEDASFLRMDNVTLGYTFGSLPGVRQLRLYGSVSNAFLITGYSGTDPEIGREVQDGPGIDNNLYPRSRTFTGGVNIQF